MRLPLRSAAVTALATALIAAAPSLTAQAPAATTATTTVAAPTFAPASATRAASAPVIDGKTDDPVWQTAQVIDQFLEYEPNTGATPRFRTEVRILYDDRYLYLLARMHDPAPDSIISLLSRRDVRTESEQLKLVIDSYHDRRTAFQFAVNPAGVKRDFYVYNDNVEDPTWDAVWDAKTSIDSLGWVAEFRIPFSQMRFAGLDEHTFGLLMVRDIARTRQRLSWPLYYRDRQGYVSQAGEVRGIARIPQPRRLEVTPYVVTKNLTRPDGPTAWKHPQEQTVGADVKWGLTSNLTVDATINPDFGQVEADPSVLNLSAFEQFFEERRPFFLEGAGIFSFRTQCDDIDEGCTGLFYSRRIGRSPALGGLYDPTGSVSSTRVLGAAKLSGRLANGLNIGMLNAVTAREHGDADQTIEPQANYAVARVLQDFNNGQSGFGAMLTAVNRTLDDDSRDYLRGEAYSGGLDFRHRFSKDRFELHATAAASLVRGSAAAIARTQRDGVHNYQRRDDDLEYDPARTSLTGSSQRLTLSKFGGGITRFQSVVQRYSPGFETNDLGWQQRADEQLFRNWFSLNYQKPTRYYRRLFMNFNSWQTWTFEGLRTGLNFNTNWHAEMPNTHWLHFGSNYGPGDVFEDRNARGGPAYRVDNNWEVWAGWEGDRRTWWTPTLFGGTWKSDGGRTWGWWTEPSFQFRAGSRFNASTGLRFNRASNAAQWYENYGDVTVDTAHITFARFDRWIVSAVQRVNFTATPNLSFQFYAQPFVVVGDYRDWIELADPGAKDFDQRFQPYVPPLPASPDPGGLNLKELNATSVMRWEYRPGSVLFLVWQHGRGDAQGAPTEFRPRRDFGEIFKLHPDNTFLLKFSYWFNP